MESLKKGVFSVSDKKPGGKTISERPLREVLVFPPSEREDFESANPSKEEDGKYSVCRRGGSKTGIDSHNTWYHISIADYSMVSSERSDKEHFVFCTVQGE